MNLIIHRGTHEIGGSCVELTSGNTRIIIDLGIPLVDKKKEKFDAKILKGKTVPQLKELGVLPPVQGLYRGEDKAVDAIFLSHCHLDHYGLLNYFHPDIPVHMSDGSRRLIEASNIFLPSKAEGFKTTVIKNRETTSIGDFEVTVRLVDHSAFDAMAFIVQSGKKKLFYSGDFRAHGRKGWLFEDMIRHPPRSIKCLLMEGTVLGRGKERFLTEEDVETDLVKALNDKKDIMFFFASSQNIDRLVSAYKACHQSGTTFVIDIYTAFVLHSLKNVCEKLPQYNLKNVRVKYFKSHADSLSKTQYKNLLYKFNSSKIEIDEIVRNRKKILMILRDNALFPIMLKELHDTAGTTVIYSMWKGYLKEKFVAFCKEKGIKILHIHTGGHATRQDLKRFANALKPQTLIPIHTFEPERFRELYKSVSILDDEEVFEI